MTAIRLASRLDRIQPSVTMAVTAKAAQLRAQGIDVVSFGAGEPDFDTPEHIKEAARQAMVDDCSSYTDVRGILPLRAAVSAELERTHGVSFGVDQIIVSTGAKQCLFNMFLALIDDGDEVIVPSPCWVSYPEQIKLAGGEPVLVETRAEDGFALHADALRAAITDRTRALLINTPCNPTGALYSRDTLAEIADVLVERDLLVITDDIYRSLVYGDARYESIVALAPELATRVIVIDGVSKTYAMTGWRIGYAAGPAPVIGAMAKLQGQSTSGAAHIAQHAAVAALTGPQECVAQMRAAFDDRRKLMLSRLRAIPGVTCYEPKGAFYAFPDLSAFLGRRPPGGEPLVDDIALCSYLVEAGRVAVVPGSGFAAPGFVRLSYATSTDQIELGLSRMAEALGALS